MSENSSLWRYYEGTTSANTVVKDLAKVLSTAVKTNALKGPDGEVVKPREVIMEKNWDIVYPEPDWSKLNVRDRDNLTPEEFQLKIDEQASKVSDTVILKTKTSPKNLGETKNEDDIGLEDDLNADTVEMYLEIYKPKYLADPEQYHPEVERKGIVPYLVTKDIYEEFAANTGHATLNLLDDLKTEDGLYPKGLTVETKTDPFYAQNPYNSDANFEKMLNSISETFKITFDKNSKVALTETQIKLCKLNLELERTLCDLLGMDANTFYKLSVITFENEYSKSGVSTKRLLKIDALRNINVYTLDPSFEYKFPQTEIIADSVSLTIGGLTYSDAWSYDKTSKTLKILKKISGESDQLGDPILTYEYGKKEDFITKRKLMYNNHYVYMRMFDKINDIGDGPIPDTVDEKTGAILSVNSKVSEWSKLSWYQDFEEIQIDEIDSDHGVTNIADGIVFLPIEAPGLNGDTRISFWLNCNNDRASIVLMGNPSLDFGKNRHLVSACYIGQIESFENSLNDTTGNFALFTSSSTSPCYSELVEKRVEGIESQLIGLGSINGDNIFQATLSGAKYFNQTGPNYRIALQKNDDEGVTNLERFKDFNVSFDEDRTTARIEIFTPPKEGVKVTITYDYYISKYSNINGVVRDSLGNKVEEVYPTSFGKNTATGVTDISMLATRSKAYFQKHHMMFTTTEEFMTKELYGKSAYTGEYYADKIKITHGNDGPRGMLSDCLAIDTSSLYVFDELIVNRDFLKDPEKDEETYIFFPITAPYSPFSGSPNATYGFAIKKSVKPAVPVTDEGSVDKAMEELDLIVGNLDGITKDIYLPILTEHGVRVSWESDKPESIKFEE